MGYIIVAGGNYGSEGKGKIASYMAKKNNAAAVCRVGGPNSGHTIVVDGKECKLRMLPTAALTTPCKIVFPAGSYIEPRVLFDEIERYNIDKSRLLIDTNAIIIDDSDKEREKTLGVTISSTCSGTGAALVRRISRESAGCTAKWRTELKGCVYPMASYLNELCARDQCVVVEGTQGYWLSVFHTKSYPYCTARDTSAAGILSEVGGSIRCVDKIVTVFRSYPIRVAGNSGPLWGECTWEDVTVSSGAPESIKEYTTVTNRLRRVANFAIPHFDEVVEREHPDIIVMNHLDYIDWEAHDKEVITPKIQDFIDKVQRHSNYKINLCGTGKDTTFEI